MSGSGSSGAPGDRSASARALDISSIITSVASAKEARALPCGSVVGDLQGGLTFPDSVAAALEARSATGWQEIQTPSNETWTVIVLDR